MAQDIALMLQQSWLLMKDGPDADSHRWAAELTDAVKNHAACVQRHHGFIPMTSSALATITADPDQMKKHVPAADAPALWDPSNHYTKALYDFKPGAKMPFPGFADDQEYHYYYGIAKAGGALPEPLAFKLIYDAYTEPLLYRYYCDDAEPPPGVNVFDLHPYYCIDGKPENYRSDRKGPGGNPKPIGSRMGPQSMAMAGIALQALKADPNIWERRYEHQFKDDLRVYVEDWPPGTRAEPVAVVPWQISQGTLRLTSTRSALRISGEMTADAVEIRIYARPETTGAFAAITVKRDGTVEAKNDAGLALLLSGTAIPAASPNGFTFSLQLPYTLVKGQQPWANGVEHERYALTLGAERRTLYLASDAGVVRAHLEYELAHGLRTWQTIFHEIGYIPTGLGTGREMDRFSDTGGYAHLITAAAQWILYQQANADWQQHHFPSTGAQLKQ
jgi:hypothetical protein